MGQRDPTAFLCTTVQGINSKKKIAPNFYGVNTRNRSKSQRFFKSAHQKIGTKRKMDQTDPFPRYFSD